MKNRIATVNRKTKETEIILSVNLDGKGKYKVNTGIGFFDHMLELFSKHSNIDLNVKVTGDLIVDEHHTVEDVGICLGDAIRKALGKKSGIARYGFLLPMDESLVEAAIDLSGRAYLVWNVIFKREKIGDMPTELFEDFFIAFTNSLRANIHINLRYGRNEHHIVEAIFKAVARALRISVEKTGSGISSTKGIL